MHISKKTIKLCTWGFVISLIMILSSTYISNTNENIFLGIITGIFTGFFVTLCTTFVSYFQERKKYFDDILKLVQTTLLNLQTGNTLLERLAGIIDSGNFFEDENINSILRDVYDFSSKNKPFWGNYIPLYDRSPKKLNKYQALFLEILNEYSKLDELKKSANRLLRLQLKLKLITTEIENQKIRLECIYENAPDRELQINNINKQIETYNLKFSSLWTSYISCFSYLFGLTKKSIEEYQKKRNALFRFIIFDASQEQLDISIMENIRLIQAQLDEIKQNNC